MILDDLRPDDRESLFLGWGDAVCCPRWALQGESPNPGLLNHLISEGVAQQRVLREPSGVAVGLLQICEVDLRNQIGYLSFTIRRTAVRPGAELPVSFVQEATESLGLRKIVVQVDADSVEGISGMLSRLRPIGRLREHSWRAPGRYEDRLFYEFYAPSPTGRDS
jgi:hypothetical protein